MMPHDPRRRRARLHDIQSVMDSLREPVESPDLTNAILGRVHDERPFLSPSVRRMLWVGRAIAASIAVGAVFGILLTRRHAPETVRMISVSVRPAPLSELADTFGAEASMFRLQPIASLRFPSFPAPMNDRGSEDPSTDEAALEPADGVALTVYPEPDSGGVQPPYALVASSFGVPAAYASNARSLARFGSFYAGGSLTIPVPSAAPQRADRNLLDDLSPVITGEPAGENLCPR